MALALEESKLICQGQSRCVLATVWLGGLIAYVVAILTASDALAPWINDVAWTLAPAFAAFACARTARDLGGRSGLPWWLLTAGCVQWLIGQLYWDYNQLVLGIELPFPNIGQLFYSSFPLFAIAAISRLPEYPHSGPLTLKHFGNIALVVCCLAVTVVLGLLEPALQSGVSSVFLWAGGLHALLVAATFLYALYALWTYRWTTTWTPMLLLVIASGIYSVTNLIYSHSVLTGSYLAGDVINASWLVVFGLIAVAAAERRWIQQHPYTAPPYRMLRRERWVEAVVPALLIIIMVMVAVSTSAVLTGRVIAWAATLFILFAVVLGAREAWIQSDAQRLTNELVSTNQQLQKANVELRDSEARYRDLNIALERRVAERTAQLERAYGELEGFSYAVAHDLKAPLRAINSFAHLLREEMGDDLEPRARDHVNRIRGGSLKMAALIDDLLSYSHIERRDLFESNVQLRTLVDSILTLYTDELQRRDVQLSVDIAAVTLFLDADGLSLALRNLVENALKYTRDAKPPHVEIRARRTESGLLITVQDNGIGFDMQYHDHIFKVFQRLHRDDQYPGTGIGLALVRKAVERLGGRVWAESATGKGAKFYVELPVRTIAA
jgi:signal transduction histidine kinase